jgi:nicotinate-nucleotide pyrophosphorylase (carboxylating)
MLRVRIDREDGTAVRPGEVVLEVRGSAQAILSAERVALNFLQRLSGIATLTRAFVDAAASTRAKILDTRKTTPGLRRLEKAAVVAGGGVNHRFGLHDMVLIKDNHLAVGGTREELAARIAQIKAARPTLRVEVEADTLDQVREFLDTPGIDIILLDNMKSAQLREAVALRKTNPVKLEASGGVNLHTVRQIAATGVDYVSVGAITHSAPAVDLSLDVTRLAS